MDPFPVVARSSAALALLLWASLAHASPQVISFTVAPNPQSEGKAITLTAAAVERDPTASLARYDFYRWEGVTPVLLGSTTEPDRDLVVNAPFVPQNQAFLYQVNVFSRNNGSGALVGPGAAQAVHTSVNQPPTIDGAAGSPNPAAIGTTVTLIGSATDPNNGGALIGSWAPEPGNNVPLTPAGPNRATFVAPAVAADTTFAFRYTVSDTDGDAASRVATVLVRANLPPTASAGEDKSVVRGGSTTLDGSGEDPEGGTLTYAWSPAAHLSQADAQVPTFTAPLSGPRSHTYTLTVTDAAGATATDTVTVSVTDGLPPVVEAGDNGAAIERSSTTLSGAATDPEGQSPLTVQWTQIAGPACAIVNPASLKAEFVSPDVSVNTLVTFRLTATDAAGNKGFDDVTFTIQDVSGAAAGGVPLIAGLKIFPSPFSPSRGGATIRYTLRSPCEVDVIVFDIFGRQVREFHAGAGAQGGTAGDNDISWDGKNGEGDDVGNGAYTVQVRARDAVGAEGRTNDRVGVRK